MRVFERDEIEASFERTGGDWLEPAGVVLRPDCPFCRWPVDVTHSGLLVCCTCEVMWGSVEEVEADRKAASDFPGNAGQEVYK